VSELAILGAGGQVGGALAALAQRKAMAHRALAHADCDISDALAVERAITHSRLVVNCAAYTAVDKAESDSEAAWRVNTLGAQNVAAACAQARIPLIHLSTDYVFDGVGTRPATEQDEPAPLNAYGRSKLAGEEKVRSSLAFHIILRTSWIFSARGQNFVKTILRRARSQAELRVVCDQVGGPTAADDLAAAILKIADACAQPGFRDWGTYHLCGAPPVSWYDFARAIVGDCGVAVRPITSGDFPAVARRPANSVLDCGRALRTFGLQQPDWRPALAQVRAALADAPQVAF
jgi:dTDP-4-dehydrorhamnose reductase